ncbi:OLC1v1036501C3 [Oldenlandia corymbosa var. corymbosa]|nr:OLC1v1036501C3 [Oldenlandia corymbosa var. corymbosa]
MLTISQPFCGYPLEDLRSREVLLQNTMMYDNLAETETSAESLLNNSPTFHHQKKRKQQEDQDGCSNHEPVKMAKKINHNASERDRRKKINGLYSSLRSLLPPAYQEKKLSIPATVSRVLKYIPELLKELEALAQKKECLARKLSDQENSASHKRRKLSSTTSSTSLIVSLSQLNDREVMIQITTMKSSSCLFAKVLSKLEQNGLVLLDSSCFESSQGRVFYNLHLEVTGAQATDMEGLKRQLVSLDENQEELLLSNFKSIGQLAEIFYK